jgi:5-methylcytosine-specific restriction enzyme A
MSLQSSFTELLKKYPQAQKEEFTGHPVGILVRKLIESHIQNDRYKVKGSVGQGNWTTAPWIGVFDTFVTETAQDGFYVVYLIKEDCSGMFLSLNQGVTTIRNQYGADAKRALSTRAKDFLAKLESVPDGFTVDDIELTIDTDSSNPVLYEAGNICSRFYPANAVPIDEILFRDLDTILSLYRELYLKERPSSNVIDQEDDEILFEDRTKMRMHKRIERNQKLSRKVKAIKGLNCEVCNFTYSDKYVALRSDYIEAHHLVPFSKLEEKVISLDPKNDFAVLCADCHRMIHRSEFISDINGFKENHLRSGWRRALAP